MFVWIKVRGPIRPRKTHDVLDIQLSADNGYPMARCIKMNSSPSCLIRGITRGLMTSSKYIWPITVPTLKTCRSVRLPVQIAAQTIRLALSYLSSFATVKSANPSPRCLQTSRRPSLKSKQNLDSSLNTAWRY
jgi:hypothetical protein